MFDFSLRNRVSNMVWTTSNKYSTNVRMAGANSYTDTSDVTIADVDVLVHAGMDYDEAVDTSLYAAAHEGAHVKCSEIEPLKKLLENGSKKGADVDLLNGIVQVTEDYRVDYTITKDRPGYDDLRNGSMRGFVKLFGSKRSGNVVADTTKAISAWTYGIDMRKLSKEWKSDLDWSKIEEIGNTIIDKAKKAKSSKDSAKIAESLYDKHFTYSKSGKEKKKDPNGEGDRDGGSESNESDDGNGDSNNSDTTENENKDNKGSDSKENENNESGNGDGESQDEQDENGDGVGNGSNPLTSEQAEELAQKSNTMDNMLDEKGKSKIERGQTNKKHDTKMSGNVKDIIYGSKKSQQDFEGKCLWSKEKWEQIERAVCKDVHAGTGTLYTKASKNYKNENDYDHRKIIISSEHLQEQAIQLSKRLQEDMRNAKDEDCIVADNGSIVANKVFRATKTNDNHVFSKKTYNDVGGYVVDLLLDGSGSQNGRRKTIRRQAFIIARACSIAGIPCRVTSYQWDGILDLKFQLRDFDDPQINDEDTFLFSASYSNRDGLSLLVSAYELMERPEENKIMIVLSDGSPAGNGGSIIVDSGGLNHYNSLRTLWNGKETSGVLDTAMVVRNIRKKGVALMGIYVGGGYRVEDEKTMYGNDFAYIKDMKTFLPKVVEYLHKQILKFS
jgi:nitric oxide reductase activation protein